MKILTYSPSREAYAAVTGNGDVAYYDLSSDITRATISRKSDTASSFTLHLLNKNGKYNDVFSPMDRVKIYLTKSKRHAVLSGYIKSAPKFNLYRSELSITGYDTIYRLQELFWDPQLIASQQQLGYSTTIGWEGVIMNLLVNVAGYDPTTVKIGSIPSEVIDWAHELYAAKQTDIEQARNMVNEFYEVLRTSGPKFATGGASSSGGGAADFTGSTSTEKVWNFCISQGFSQEAAAATIGNAMQESSCDPACMQSGGGPGRGIFQWEIGSGRFDRLVEIATSMGKEWSDIEAQLTLFQEEAEGCFQAYTGKTYTYPNGTVTWWPSKVSYSEWKSWTDIPKATECLERVYMRPSVPNRPRRIQLAQEAYAEYAK